MKKLRETLGPILETVEKRFQEKPQRVIEAFAEIVGADVAADAKAERFEKGVLYVRVGNATLLMLLKRHEKTRILEELKQKFGENRVVDVRFSMKQFG